MIYMITYYDANHEKQIRFFRSFERASKFIKMTRKSGSNLFYDFKIKIIKPY